MTKAFINIFEKNSELYPDNVAIKFKNVSLTYSELNKEANKLAYYLQSKYQVASNDLIGIIAERSEKMVIGILAILKCGGAFVPIDPGSSSERFNFLIDDTAIKIALYNIPETNLPKNSPIDFIDLNSKSSYLGNGENVKQPINLNDTAYVMYTSGSTGVPKGVLIKHESLLNFIDGYIKSFKINETDVFIQISNFLFDSCISEIFVPLTTGGKVIIPEKGIQSYPEGILKEIAENNVSIIFLTPVMLQLILDYINSFKIETSNLKCLKRVITGGETVTLKLTNLFNEILYQYTGTELTVAYGPTETTVWVTIWDWTPNVDLKIIPIGKPTENIDIYILDEKNDKLLDGQEGEIVIGGKAVGGGYLNREDLNREKFLPNPFRPGEKIYKTGDKGRILPDGNLEFLGRIDNLVKLNGTRIELNEIENNILKLSKIKECVVLMKLIHNANELVVYFTTKKQDEDEKQVIDEIITSLNLVLPSFSIPNFYFKLDAFLINQNGKIDRNNLPLPKSRYFKHEKPFIEPSTQTEKKLTFIIEEILNAEQISIDDVIFNIGVKSILVTKIIIEIKKRLNTSISVSQFFHFPTIRLLSLFIDNQIVEHPNPFTLLRPGKGEPVFLIPGYMGDQFSFADIISNYHQDHPIYSIDMSKFDEFNSYTDYLSTLSSYLISQIKKIKQNGPYNLVGYSLGGLVCFEIASQLQKENNKIGLLAIIGSPPPYYREGLLSKLSVLRELNIFLKPEYDVIKKYLKYRISHILRVIAKKSHITKANNKNGNNVKPETFSNNEIAPNPFNDGTLLFKMSFKTSLNYHGKAIIIYENLKNTSYPNFKIEEYYIYHIMPEMWKRFIKGKIDFHTIDCLHEEIIIEPYAKKVAEIIESYFCNAVLNGDKIKVSL